MEDGGIQPCVVSTALHPRESKSSWLPKVNGRGAGDEFHMKRPSGYYLGRPLLAPGQGKHGDGITTTTPPGWGVGWYHEIPCHGPWPGGGTMRYHGLGVVP